MIEIDKDLRLRRYDGNYMIAHDWYQDEETIMLMDGKVSEYTNEKIKGMYDYLMEKGELYFIEVAEKGIFHPIGDVTFWKEDMPIVIGDKAYRGKGIGLKVIQALIKRAKELGLDRIYVEEIYSFNNASQRCFEKAGFKCIEESEEGKKYELVLQS